MLTSSSTRRCMEFSIDEIKAATNQFDRSNILGQGGEAKVYFAEIFIGSNKTPVAVKHLEDNSKEFEREIKTLSNIHHPNLVSLIGYCDESGHKILVYEYMAKGCLSDYLKNKSCSVSLSWMQRLNICLDVARGLQHLHTETDEFPKGIIHRDVKPGNILVGENWVAKLSDFGMFKLSNVGQEKSLMIASLKGTSGYYAPEYLENGCITRKIDVYSFGVVLFQVLCRKMPWDRGDESYYAREEEDLGIWAQQNVDAQIQGEISGYSLLVFTDIIRRSLQANPDKRPIMDSVVLHLEKVLEYQESGRRPTEDGVMQYLQNALECEESEDLAKQLEGVVGFLPKPPRERTEDRTVKQLLLQKALIVPETTSIHKACRQMALRMTDALLLSDSEGLLCGILTDKDIATKVIACDLNPEDTPVSNIMTRNSVFVLSETLAVEALQMMVQGKFRHLPVVENDKVIALLSIENCLYDAISHMERAAGKGKAIADVDEGYEKYFEASVSGPNEFVESLGERMLFPSLSTIITEDSKSVTVSPSDTVVMAAKKMLKSHISSAVVRVENKLLGILTSKDILMRVISLDLPPDSTLVEKVMTPNPECVLVDTPIINALHTMRDGKFVHLPVVDKDGILVAILDVFHITHAVVDTVRCTLSRQSSLAQETRNESDNCFIEDDSGDEYEIHSGVRLMYLASEGDLEGLNELLDSGVDINFRNNDDRTALHVAACQGSCDVAAFLLQHGAEVDRKDRWGSTPLADAIHYKNREVIKLLERHGAKPLMATMHVKNTREIHEYEIDPKELDFTNSVYITKRTFCIASWHGTQVAVKMLGDDVFNDDGKVRAFRNELEVLQKLRHPNIVQFLVAVTQCNPMMIVTEYLPKGDLRSLLMRKGSLKPAQAVRYAMDIARGMNYLHEHKPDPIIHGALEPSNILRDNTGNLKVASFGVNEYRPLTNKETTCRYVAPEVFRNEEYETKVDVFSFALIVQEMIEGCHPFQAKNENEVLKAYAANKRPPFRAPLKFYSYGLKELIIECWSENPTKRPTFKKIIPRLDSIYNRLVQKPQSKMIQLNYSRKLKAMWKKGSPSQSSSSSSRRRSSG